MVNLVDIVLVKSDPIMSLSSLRDQRIIRSLRKKYSVIVLGWNRGGTKVESNNHESYLKLLNLRATYGHERYGTIRFLPYLPIFWGWVFIKLCQYKPECIHSCNLDSFIPSYLYKVLFRKKLVFDVFDRYAMAYIPRNRNLFFRMLYSFVNWIEEEFARSSDVLINISDQILKTYSKRPKNCITIMNCSEDHAKSASRIDGNSFRLLFTGHLRPGRGLEILPEIVKHLKGICLIITGNIEDRNLLNKITGIPNINYQGFLDHEQVLELEASSDAMIGLYDLKLQTQNEYVMGNKLFESMMSGKPMISNVAQDIITEANSGIVVDYESVEQIKEAILTLRDNPQLCKRLGDNARKAFVEKYNWGIMEKRLYKVYDSLLEK